VGEPALAPVPRSVHAEHRQEGFLGMSTRPTRFIRFLPSFCFSISLRLRLMSPP